MTPGSGDQTATIQAAFNRADSGDTIYFDPGIFTVDGSITPKTGQLYIGGAGAGRPILSGSGSIDANPDDSHDIMFYGLRFDRVTLNPDGNNRTESVNRFNVVNCIFNGSGNKSQITPNSWKNSTLQWCTFNDGGGIDGSGGGIDCDYLTITRNKFVNVLQPISLNPSDNKNANRNIAVTFNYMTGVYRIGIEVNGTGSSQYTLKMRINDNYYDGISLRPITDGNALALSIVAGGATGLEIARNYIYAGRGIDQTNATYKGYAIEFDAGGVNAGTPGYANIHDNYIDGRRDNKTGGWDASIYGPYTNVEHRITNNNFWTTRGPDVVVGSKSIVSGTTHIDRGKPRPPACGAEP